MGLTFIAHVSVAQEYRLGNHNSSSSRRSIHDGTWRKKTKLAPHLLTMATPATPPVPAAAPIEDPQVLWDREALRSDMFEATRDAIKMLEGMGVECVMASAERTAESFADCGGLPIETFRRPADLLQGYALPNTKFVWRYNDGVLMFSSEPLERPTVEASDAFRIHAKIIYELARLAPTFSSQGCRAIKRDLGLSDEVTFDARHRLIKVLPLSGVAQPIVAIVNSLKSHETVKRCAGEKPLHNVIVYWNVVGEGAGRRFIYFVRDKTIDALQKMQDQEFKKSNVELTTEAIAEVQQTIGGGKRILAPIMQTRIDKVARGGGISFT